MKKVSSRSHSEWTMPRRADSVTHYGLRLQSGNLLNLKASSLAVAPTYPQSVKDDSSIPGEGEESGKKCPDPLLC